MLGVNRGRGRGRGLVEVVGVVGGGALVVVVVAAVASVAAVRAFRALTAARANRLRPVHRGGGDGGSLSTVDGGKVAPSASRRPPCNNGHKSTHNKIKNNGELIQAISRGFQSHGLPAIIDSQHTH